MQVLLNCWSTTSMLEHTKDRLAYTIVLNQEKSYSFLNINHHHNTCEHQHLMRIIRRSQESDLHMPKPVDSQDFT